jgi:sterol desaturase/sphingolipid hydroxylase (fatty acid hydroxylase superfamily)
MGLVLEVILSCLIGFVVSNFSEWVVHKYILHGLGKKKDSFFNFHWQHHNISRKNKFVDNDYKEGLGCRAIRREILGIVALLFFNINWLFMWPMLFAWFTFFSIAYYFIHSYSHINPQWCRKWVPWHYDHHMGIDQNKNWGVTSPFWDYILGTRVKYVYDDNGKAIKVKQS